MRLLFTGDWQLSFMNLDKAKLMVKEILSIVERRRIDAIINTGDVKEVYNPIDVRVANFAVDTCNLFHRKNIDHLVLRGNHDRVGMYDDSQNWLPILARAGALTYDKPEIISMDGKTHVHMLPFMTDKEKLKEAAKELAEEADEFSVLAFHDDLMGCSYNLMSKSESQLKPKHMYPARYQVCIGGHIHLMQRVTGNIWYAGSPFAMDWGEANQLKGYLLVDTEKKIVKPIYSQIPRLYDPLWPNFDKVKPDSWDGAEIRIHVPYDNSVQDLSQLLTKTRLKGQRDYPGAKILPVAEYVSDEKADGNSFLDENSTDEEHVAEYVKQTCWDHLLVDRKKIVTYMVARLKNVGISARQNTRVEFIRARGVNFGCFKEIELNFKTKGITVLLGKNEDWRNRSNGSGKTTALQIPAVALFGQTFKGQKNDRWARRGSLKKSMAIVELKTLEGKLYKVIRCRRPHRLVLKYWNGSNWVDLSTGNRKESTEALIEKKIGFTWQMLSNAIYIDQDRTNALLSGTDGERRKLLEQFQFLERYHLAQELVKRDLKKLLASIQETETDIEATKLSIKNLEETVDALDVDKLADLKRAWLRIKKKSERIEAKYKPLNDRDYQRLSDIVDRRDKLERKMRVWLGRAGEAKGRYDYLDQVLKKFQKLKGNCPTCHQKIDEDTKVDHVAEMHAEQAELWQDHEELRKEYKVVKERFDKLVAKIHTIEEGIEKRKSKQRELDKQKDAAFNAYDKVKAVNVARKEMRQKIDSLKKKLGVFREDLQNKLADQTFYEYCIESFSRKGLPAFLNALLCPKLNKAAEYYSQLFADKAVQVRFESNVDGDFDVRVLNAFGGEHIEDQSRGEIKMASLITSFALRDVSISSNLLNLDEPGEGLDSQNARRFAVSLRKLEPRFGSIWLTTHNPAIMAELSGERQMLVVKRNGVSELT